MVKVTQDEITERPHYLTAWHPKNEKLLKQSFLKFGQTRPIILDKDGVIGDGQRLFNVMKDCGEKEFWVVKMDVPWQLICFGMNGYHITWDYPGMYEIAAGARGTIPAQRFANLSIFDEEEVVRWYEIAGKDWEKWFQKASGDPDQQSLF